MRICLGGGASFRILEGFSIAGGERTGSESMRNSGKILMRKSLSSRNERVRGRRERITYEATGEALDEKITNNEE